MAQRLLVFQSLWGMRGLSVPALVDAPLEAQLEAIAEAGFDGVTINDLTVLDEALPVVHRLGLRWVAQCYPRSLEMLAEPLELAARLGAEHLNAQPNVRPHTLEEGVAYLTGWMRMAERAGVRTLFETHRDRLTTDLFYTLRLLDALPELRLTGDLSHYLVGREFPFPVTDDNHALIARVTDRCDAYHGRVATREQVQVPLLFPSTEPWLELALRWWQTGFESWSARSGADAELIFTTELGPPPYAIVGADGGELSDRWSEATAMMGLVRKRFADSVGGA
jgi:hypothetical protein